MPNFFHPLSKRVFSQVSRFESLRDNVSELREKKKRGVVVRNGQIPRLRPISDRNVERKSPKSGARRKFQEKNSLKSKKNGTFPVTREKSG